MIGSVRTYHDQVHLTLPGPSCELELCKFQLKVRFLVWSECGNKQVGPSECGKNQDLKLAIFVVQKVGKNFGRDLLVPSEVV